MKKVFALLLVLTMAFGLVGCSSQDEDVVEIRVLTRMAGTSRQVEIFREIIAEFEAKYDDVKVIDESQGDESAYNNKLQTDLASGTLPHIFRIQGVANLGQYIENGLIMDMDPILTADPEWGAGFTEGALAYYQVPGYEGTYAIPMESGLIGVYYNEKLLQQAGVEEFPETWDDLKVAIEKLKAINITPIAMGAHSTYTVGHLHNQIFYKWLGTEAAKSLGARNMNWTDPKVIETLAFVDELNKMGAFGNDAAGISADIAATDFLEGRAAMTITGPWSIGKFSNPEETAFVDSIKVAKFPYFAEKPEFKDNDMQVISPYMVNGKLEGKEKEYTIELLKMLTSADAAKKFAEESQFLIPRTDIDIDSTKVSPLFLQNIELGSTSTGIAVDVFDFDPLPSMQDRTRNSLVGILVGGTPETAADEIQREIDRSK